MASCRFSHLVQMPLLFRVGLSPHTEQVAAAFILLLPGHPTSERNLAVRHDQFALGANGLASGCSMSTYPFEQPPSFQFFERCVLGTQGQRHERITNFSPWCPFPLGHNSEKHIPGNLGMDGTVDLRVARALHALARSQGDQIDA